MAQVTFWSDELESDVVLDIPDEQYVAIATFVENYGDGTMFHSDALMNLFTEQQAEEIGSGIASLLQPFLPEGYGVIQHGTDDFAIETENDNFTTETPATGHENPMPQTPDLGQTEEGPMESLTPEDISGLISEDLKPGRMGFLSEETTGQEDQVDYGVAIQTIENLAQHMLKFAKELSVLAQQGKQAVNDQNTAIQVVRNARLKMGEINGAASMAIDQTSALAKYYKLPDVKF